MPPRSKKLRLLQEYNEARKQNNTLLHFAATSGRERLFSLLSWEGPGVAILKGSPHVSAEKNYLLTKHEKEVLAEWKGSSTLFKAIFNNEKEDSLGIQSRKQADAEKLKRGIRKKLKNWVVLLGTAVGGDGQLCTSEKELFSVSQMLLSIGHVESDHQIWHMDAYPGKKKELSNCAKARKAFVTNKDQFPPLSAICALDESFELNVIPHSHRWYWEEGKGQEDLKPIRITVPRGCILFFRQDLIHSGASFLETNLRYHVYLDAKEKIRLKDGTIQLDPEGPYYPDHEKETTTKDISEFIIA
jgi:hypothetical protein